MAGVQSNNLGVPLNQGSVMTWRVSFYLDVTVTSSARIKVFEWTPTANHMGEAGKSSTVAGVISVNWQSLTSLAGSSGPDELVASTEVDSYYTSSVEGSVIGSSSDPSLASASLLGGAEYYDSLGYASSGDSVVVDGPLESSSDEYPLSSGTFSYGSSEENTAYFGSLDVVMGSLFESLESML